MQLDEEQEVHLGQLVDSWIVYLDRRAGPYAVPMRNRVGLRALAHRTGCGKAALAMLRAPERHALVRDGCRLESTPTPDLATRPLPVVVVWHRAILSREVSCSRGSPPGVGLRSGRQAGGSSPKM